MTRDYCDRCKKELISTDGPVFVSFIHRLGDEMLCVACFSKQSVWKSLTRNAHKEIVEHIALEQKQDEWRKAIHRRNKAKSLSVS